MVYEEDFASVAKKWQDAKYAGKFDFVHSMQEGEYFGIADYKVIFDIAWIFFLNGKLKYFQIASDKYQLKLCPDGQEKEVVLFKIGSPRADINKLSTSISKTYLNRNASRKEGYNLNFNLGDYGEAAYLNDLVVTTTESGMVTGFIYYGHF